MIEEWKMGATKQKPSIKMNSKPVSEQDSKPISFLVEWILIVVGVLLVQILIAIVYIILGHNYKFDSADLLFVGIGLGLYFLLRISRGIEATVRKLGK